MGFNKIIRYCMTKGIQVRFTPEKVREDHNIVNCHVEFFEKNSGKKISDIPDYNYMIDERVPISDLKDLIMSKLIENYGD